MATKQDLSKKILKKLSDNDILKIEKELENIPSYAASESVILTDEQRAVMTKQIAEKYKEIFNLAKLDYLNDENLKIIVQDVANEINLIEKIDYIVHAASPASPKYYNIDPVGVIMPNILGTKNTLELARKNNIEGYLYFSSGEVYGQLNDGEVVNEDKYGYLDPTSVRACYGESKRMGENLCVSYGHQHNIPIKIVRPFHTYGPGMKLDDGRVFADFVKNIVNNEDIETLNTLTFLKEIYHENNLDKRNNEHINNKNSVISKKISQNINYNFKQLTIVNLNYRLYYS